MKDFKNLGKALTKAEQKMINGGKTALVGTTCYMRIDETLPCNEGYTISTADETAGQCCANL